MCHVLDTAAVAEHVLERILGNRCRDELTSAFEPLGDPGWVALLSGLHDLGKFSPSFLAKVPELAVQGFDQEGAADIRAVQRRSSLGRPADTPHGLVTAMHVKDLLASWGAPPETAEYVAVALGGHHGYFPDGTALRQTRREVANHGRDTWRGWRDDFIREVAQLRGLPDPSTVPWQDVHVGLGAAVALAGLTSVSDWIASDTNNFPYAERPDPRPTPRWRSGWRSQPWRSSS